MKAINNFGARLKTIRLKRELTQRALGQRSGIAETAINHFENGRRKPAFDNIAALACALHVTTDSLFFDDQIKGTEFVGEGKLSRADRVYIQGIINVMLKQKAYEGINYERS